MKPKSRANGVLNVPCLYYYYTGTHLPVHVRTKVEQKRHYIKIKDVQSLHANPEYMRQQMKEKKMALYNGNQCVYGECSVYITLPIQGLLMRSFICSGQLDILYFMCRRSALDKGCIFICTTQIAMLSLLIVR